MLRKLCKAFNKGVLLRISNTMILRDNVIVSLQCFNEIFSFRFFKNVFVSSSDILELLNCFKIVLNERRNCALLPCEKKFCMKRK